MIEFYQDPTLTIGPAIMRSILNRFMDGMAGVKIAVNVFLDEADTSQYALTGQVVQQYLEVSLAESEDPEEELLDVRAPANGPEKRSGEKPESFAQHRRSDHGRDDGLLCLLHRHIHSAKHSQGGRGAHPAALVHHAHIAGNHPDRQTPIRVHDRFVQVIVLLVAARLDLRNSMGRLSCLWL